MAWFRVLVGSLGQWAKWLALAGTAALYVAAGIAFGAGASRLVASSRRKGAWPAWQVIAGGMAVGSAHWLVLRLLLNPTDLVPQRDGPLAGPLGHLVADLLVGVVFVAMLVSRRPRVHPGRISDP